MKRAFRVLAQVGRVLTGRQMAGRGVTVFPDDVFVVSYPRSGNTWARFLVSNLIHPEELTTFANVESRIPEIYFNADHVMRRLARPRILKSHECFQPHYPRIIYLARDPRDVAISFYHHNVKWRNIPENYPMEEFVPRFMAAEFDTRWGSWSDHVMSWLSMRQGRKEFLFLRYEDMKRNPMAALASIAEFLKQYSFDIDTNEQRLAEAIEWSSPERMREMEKQQARKWVLTKQTRQDKPFVRTATAGGWKSVLSERSVVEIESGWGDIMQRLDYPLATPSYVTARS